MKILNFLKNIFSGKHKKRNIWLLIVLILVVGIGYFIFKPKNNIGSIQAGFVTKQDLKETVLATGQVVSETDLSLSFQSSGVVSKISVKEGDKVYQGQVLASLNQASALATLTSAEGSLAQAQANYNKLINGATQNDIQVLQNAYDLANVNLNNTYSSTLNVLNDAYTKIYNSYNVVISLQNDYFSSSDQEGIKVSEARWDISTNAEKAKTYLDTAIKSSLNSDIDLAVSQMLVSLNNVFNDLKIIREQCDRGVYYYTIPSTDKTAIDSQKTIINTTITGVINSRSSIASYKVSLKTAENNLSARQAQPRQEDIDLAKGQVLSAQGQVDSAQAILNNMIVVAPSAGTITKVDVKVGEQATASKEVMVLQDTGSLYTEADVSEANVASLQVGQTIDYTFDALGPDQHFVGKVLTINPASTVISGVVNYKITGSLENMPNIKPGMTANMTILVAQENNVLAVPSTAIISKNSKQYVRVIYNSKNKKYSETEVQTGLQADGGLVEIISGLNDGQEIVTYLKP
jgi:HlyD family secretion protein